jgi:uncharacterized protein YuzE
MISPRNMGTSPTRRYDEDADVLYIELDSPMTGGQAEFDNEEIFIFRDGESDEVIGFAIHSYKIYWPLRAQQSTP